MSSLSFNLRDILNPLIYQHSSLISARKYLSIASSIFLFSFFFTRRLLCNSLDGIHLQSSYRSFFLLNNVRKDRSQYNVKRSCYDERISVLNDSIVFGSSNFQCLYTAIYKLPRLLTNVCCNQLHTRVTSYVATNVRR